MHRRFTYALAAGLLSSGAPARLLGVRPAKDPADRATNRYVTGATAIAFAWFGYMLGRQTDQLMELSDTDALTGLLNARGFAVRLRGEVKRARRYREPLTVLFLDLDGMKVVNDQYGHRAGSAALRNVASLIRSELRETDVAARWGGDEFTVVAPNTSREPAVALANRIRSRIAEDRASWPLTASIGVATGNGDTDGLLVDPASLLRNADAAMYEAKERGRNMVVSANGHPAAASV